MSVVVLVGRGGREARAYNDEWAVHDTDLSSDWPLRGEDAALQPSLELWPHTIWTRCVVCPPPPPPPQPPPPPPVAPPPGLGWGV